MIDAVLRKARTASPCRPVTAGQVRGGGDLIQTTPPARDAISCAPRASTPQREQPVLGGALYHKRLSVSRSASDLYQWDVCAYG